MELAIILWVIFSAVVAQHAHHYGRSGLGWFLAALLFSPLLVGLIAVLFVRKPAEGRLIVGADGRVQREPDTVPCPICAEPIRPAALKCRWCGADLQGAAKEAPAVERGARLH